MVDLANAVVIANPAAAGGRVGRRWQRIEGLVRGILGQVDIRRTEGPGHARSLAREALWAGRDVLLSLGGDGTHGEVIAGVVRDRPSPGQVTVGVLPVGTGGDFRRMIRGSGDLEEQARRLLVDDPHPIDVGLLSYRTRLGEPAERIFLNEASLGVSGRVCERVNASRKPLGGRVAYFLASLGALATYRPSRVRLVLDGQELGEFRLGTVMIANGRYAGGGMCFAPDARLDDGLLDVTVVHRASWPRMVALAPTLYWGDVRRARGVSCFRGFHLRVEAVREGTLTVEADGEPLGHPPVEASVMPGAIRMIGVRPDVLTASGPGPLPPG